jgi:hypothetical protein
MQLHGKIEINYDPLGRTFYYLPTTGLLRSLSETKVVLFCALLDRTVNRYPYSIEAHHGDQLLA